MRSCLLKKTTAVFSAVLLVLCLALPIAAHAASAGVIDSIDGLRVAVENAKDGDVLLVGDVNFGSQENPIVISKSLTLRSHKDHGSAIFTYGSFILNGTAGKISVTFDNITFYSDTDAATIEDEVWEDDVEAYQPALRFSGSVDAELTDCVFRNYMSFSGANITAVYDDTDAELNIHAAGCSFLGNAVCGRGGAVLLIGQKDKNNVLFTAEDCAFTGNLSANRRSSFGGGAIYAEAAVLKLTGCSFSANEASHQYLLPEEETEGEGEEAEPVYANYADATRGGAIYAVNSSLMMKDCVVTQCSASLGGGLALENSDFVFLNGIIAHTRAESALVRKDLDGMKAETGMGGGLFVAADHAVIAEIINSSVYGNSALNAYGGICFGGADGNALPFTVRMLLCTYAGNTVDTDYRKPDVDRSQFTPQIEEEEPQEGESESEKTAEAKAAEAAKKAEETQKAANEAYEKAVAEAIAKIVWTEAPGNIFDAPFLNMQASVIIDETFSELGHNKLAFPRHETPDDGNGYSYYAAEEIARADGYMPNVPSAVFTHVIPNNAFREAFPLPDGMAEEVFSPYFDKVLGSYSVGDNNGGSLNYQLMLDNAVWKTVEAEKTTPSLPVPEKEGHSFDLWPTSDGKPYEEGISFITASQPLTLQVNAEMHPNTYTLHFTSEAGTQDVQQVYGTPVTLPAASEKKNYDFVNWYKSDGTVAKDGEVYLVLGDSSYTAQYTKHFPKTAVIALSAAIALIALYLIIARIAEHLKKTKPAREAKKAEKAAQKEAAEKAKAEEQARKAQEKAKQKAEEQARKKAEAEEKARAKAEEEARKAEEKAAKAAAKEAEKAAKEAEKAAREAGKAAEKAAKEAEKKAAEGAAVIAGTAAAAAAGAEAAGETAEAVTEKAEEAVAEAAGEAAETVEAAVESAEKTAEAVAEKAEEAAAEAAGEAAETAAQAKDAIAAAADTIAEAISGTADEAAKEISSQN